MCKIKTETIVSYMCTDGTRWEVEDEALSHQLLIEQVDDVMGKLLPVDDNDMQFVNGDYYVQQHADVVIKAREELYKLSQGYMSAGFTPVSPYKSWSNEKWYWYFSDVNVIAMLANAWRRFWCIDSSYREWGQVYYATRE